MKGLKATAVVVVLLGLGLVAVAFVPPLHGQERGRALTILSGRGAALGIRIADAASGGVEVEAVDPDGAGERAGLKRGDVIVEFDGEHVRGGRQFARLVQETPPGRTVKATIMREGRRQDLQITPADERQTAILPDGGRFFDGDRLRDFSDEFNRRLPGLERGFRDLPFDFRFDFDVPAGGGGRLGISVDPLTRQLAEYFGARDGVLVTSVSDGSAAARAGLKAGDVITSINGEAVASPADLTRAVRQSSSDEVTIGIVREKKETTLTAKIEARRPPRGARPV
jgi:serine protease Do